ncbi:hypothetical protein HHK36_022874 [Tetracentron sinense]|uniref:BRCT domain-containing protein n=1 Tax=Tetracentron sinense TaxID=13715 RepID=A0A834YSQ1_TETSI|nr:hypothetical protein HHK36_022874 [Tetracentron sinense]
MGSAGDDEEPNSLARNSITDIRDTETQSFDAQSPSSLSSGENLKDGNTDEFHLLQNTVPFDDTIPLENSLCETQLMNLDGDTQVLDNLDCVENVTTRLSDECETEVVTDSGSGGTDRTEVWSDADGLSDDDSARRVGGDFVDLEKLQHNPLCTQGVKDFVMDSDASSNERHSSGLHVSTAPQLHQAATKPRPGFVYRGFTSIRVASLRASGLAAHKVTPKETYSESVSIPTNTQSGKEHIIKDNGAYGIRDPSSIGIKTREVDRDNDIWKCNGSMKGSWDESKRRVGNSTVRKLFTQDTLAENKVLTSNAESTDDGRDLPKFHACDHEFAGLDYVESQEPGELSQAHALDIVDRFLSVNNVELFQEVNPGKTTRRKSPPFSSAKGTHSLARRANLRYPVGGIGIFDWVDSREDEGGGDLFSRRKAAFFDGRGHGRGSFTQPQKPRSLDFKRGRGIVDEIRVKGERLNLHKKMMGIIHSDSRLMLHDSKENDKIVQVSEMKIKKNLVKQLDEQLNVESSGQQLEACGVSRDMLGILDVGFDTQIAADSTEALFCGGPASHDAEDAYQGIQNVPGVSPKGVTKNNDCLKRVSPKKRACSSDSRGITRQSKRTKRLDTKLSNEASISFQKRSKKPRGGLDPEFVKAKVKKAKLMADQQLYSGTSANEIESSGRRFEQQKAETVDKDRIKEVDRCHSSSTTNGHLSFSKEQLEDEYLIFTPIAHRTRQRSAVNPLKRTDSLANDSGVGTNGLTELGVLKDKRKGSSIGANALTASSLVGKRYKLRSSQTGEVINNKLNQQEQPDLVMASPTSCVKRDALSYPRGRRTRQNMSGHSNGSGNLYDPFMVADVEEADGQSNTRHKRSNSDVRITSINLDMKRKTRSSTFPHPLSSSSQKSPEGRLLKQNQDEPGSVNAVVKMVATVSCGKRDALCLPRGRITHQNMSGHSNGAGNLDGPSTLVDGEVANVQSITRPKKLKNDVGSTSVNLDTRRKTRSSVYPHLLSSTSEKNPERSLLKQNLDEHGSPVNVTCNLVGTKASRHSSRKGDADTIPMAESAEADVKLEVSPKGKVKPSGLVCSTPVNCTTPINVASPVCMGNEYHKQSYKRNLSRPSLRKQLNIVDATEAVPTPALKDMTRTRDMTHVRVLFSHHLDEDIIKQQKKILARLGVSIASSISDATHFVTDKFVRTRNMLEAIALGKLVVTHLWLESCGQASSFINEKNYILRDARKEKEIGFSMPVSLVQACRCPLLQGKRVLITPNTKPGKELIASLVKAVHGQAVERIGRSAMKDDKIPNDLLILSCEEDYAICVPFLEKGAAVYCSELLLNGIVTQKLEYERHCIFMDHVKRTRSTIWLRKDGNRFLPVSKRQ